MNAIGRTAVGVGLALAAGGTLIGTEHLTEPGTMARKVGTVVGASVLIAGTFGSFASGSPAMLLGNFGGIAACMLGAELVD